MKIDKALDKFLFFLNSFIMSLNFLEKILCLVYVFVEAARFERFYNFVEFRVFSIFFFDFFDFFLIFLKFVFSLGDCL